MNLSVPDALTSLESSLNIQKKIKFKLFVNQLRWSFFFLNIKYCIQELRIHFQVIQKLNPSFEFGNKDVTGLLKNYDMQK